MHLFIYNPYSIVNERIWSRRPALNLDLTIEWFTAGARGSLFSFCCGLGDNVYLETAISAQLSQLVELIGIEPTTPCLQSRCSPS